MALVNVSSPDVYCWLKVTVGKKVLACHLVELQQGACICIKTIANSKLDRKWYIVSLAQLLLYNPFLLARVIRQPQIDRKRR
jgi:hypothetical protein